MDAARANRRLFPGLKGKPHVGVPFFHLLNMGYFPVGCKGNLVPLEICVFFSGLKQMEACRYAGVRMFERVGPPKSCLDKIMRTHRILSHPLLTAISP